MKNWLTATVAEILARKVGVSKYRPESVTNGSTEPHCDSEIMLVRGPAVITIAYSFF